MVLEIAQIDIKPGMEAEFEAGVAKAAPIFKRVSSPAWASMSAITTRAPC